MPRCEYCGRHFKSVQGLKRHIITQHPHARDDIKLVTRREMIEYVNARIGELEKKLRGSEGDVDTSSRGSSHVGPEMYRMVMGSLARDMRRSRMGLRVRETIKETLEKKLMEALEKKLARKE